MTAAEKYSEALELYRTTDLSITEISARCGVSRKAFADYIQRAHRDLMYLRHGIEPTGVEKRLRKSKGQTPASRRKYLEAIEACDSLEYITLNVSQIARLFNLDGTALANQIKAHYPEILERREKERRRRGIADNYRRGARNFSVEAYARPLQLLRESDITIEEAADACQVSYTGLRQHLLVYHKELAAAREQRRAEGQTHPLAGRVSGNGAIRQPARGSNEKYARAVELYRTTSLTVKEICAITGNNPASLRSHLRLWHRQLMLMRRGAPMPDGSTDRPPLGNTGRIVPAVAQKYAGAIEIYRTTTESLKSIAARLGIAYNSIGSYLRRNMPEIITEHNRLVSKAEQ